MTRGNCKTAYDSPYHPVDAKKIIDYTSLTGKRKLVAIGGKKNRHGAFTVRRKVTIILHKLT